MRTIGTARSLRGGFWLLAVSALWLLRPAPLSAAPAIDLLGTWYVLVHYKDQSTNNPEFERWLDRIWVFESKGSRLQWTEYPIVVFRNETGRFEGLGTNRQRRVLDFWEPAPDQWLNIQEGLEVNPRGAKIKTLRGSPERGYKSMGALRTASASVIGYHEAVSIQDLEAMPVFARDDVMGSGRSEMMEGRTEYATTKISAEGSLLEGRYRRDGNQEGSFRMMRAGDVANVGTKKTQQQRQRENFMSQYGGSIGTLPDADELKERLRSGDLSGEEAEEFRNAYRKEIRQLLERELRSSGMRLNGNQLESMARKIEELSLDEGKSDEEISTMLSSGQILP